VKLIMRGLLGFLAVVLVGIIYSLVISHSNAAALQLILSGAVLAYFGRLFRKHLIGSVGVVMADAVVVEPGKVLGIKLTSPAGRFPIDQFQAVRVECITNPISIPSETQIGPHERVSLIGKAGIPDILIARTDRDAGRTLGHDLARALNLPVQEQLAPY
jgi:hypothetical protein